MEDWYTLYKTAKAKQREYEIRAMNLALLKSGKPVTRTGIFYGYRKALNHLGKVLETQGRNLQKRFQTC
ncbi:MAG: hypothetical protein GY729_04520 [Desulfobacteraceae bacterium]|nr:hypothetical protein [Desulfobacteraceae bacterium]